MVKVTTGSFFVFGGVLFATGFEGSKRRQLVGKEQLHRRRHQILVVARADTFCRQGVRQDDDNNDNDENDKGAAAAAAAAMDKSRRKMIGAAGSSSAVLGLFVPWWGNHLEEAWADDEGKIILRTSASNSPKKYPGTSTSPLSPLPVEEISPVTDPDARRISIFERAAPSVVFIDTFVEQKDAFSMNVMEVPLGAGSGFVWDEHGHIVTNYHVVRQAKSAQVAILSKVLPGDVAAEGGGKKRPTAAPRSPSYELTSPFTSMRPGSDPGVTDFTRKVFKARVVGVDPGKDIAVLKIDAPVFDLYPIPIGTSKGLRVGQQSLAIGNPFGLDHTLTAGIISGLGREVRSPTGRIISNVIQTDAAINPGNSGGTLLDINGRLIGMNTAIYSPSGASAGIGFAIPVDTVKYIVETLLQDGRIVRPALGISYLESKQARALGITKGVLVLDVPLSSPAYKAGLRGTKRTESGLIEIGDIIVAIEDDKIDTESDLFQALEMFKPGERVRVTVKRPDLESPNSTRLKLRDVVVTIQLKASSELPTGGSLYGED